MNEERFWETCDRTGERHGMVKLTEEAVRIIRLRHDARSGVTHAVLAAEFGVRAKTVAAIVQRRIWRHI